MAALRVPAATVEPEVQPEVATMEKPRKRIEIRSISYRLNQERVKFLMMMKKDQNVSNVTKFLEIFSRKFALFKKKNCNCHC